MNSQNLVSEQVGARRGLVRRTAVVLGVLLLLAAVLAPEARAVQPCCEITKIDRHTGVVTARETATGRTFQFKVSNALLLRALKVGQELWGDFGT